MYKIMIIEDEPKIGQMLQSHIKRYGLQVFVTKDFDNILDVFMNIQPHVVLININSSNSDGYDWCHKIRSISICPIFFISESSDKMEQIMALENGADDYIIKPISLEVLISKIQSYLRRVYGEYAQKIEERIVQESGLILYPERGVLQLNKKIISLTKSEALLIDILLKEYPYTVSGEVISQRLWYGRKNDNKNLLSVTVTRTRKKLEKIGIYRALQAVRGRGYRMKITWEN
ncbi:two-component system response regulator [Bacillus thuringiensis serovar yunnanensis]|nr:two-component system response regulator [Bacillus thuringiensis serovar yunnanensis]